MNTHTKMKDLYKKIVSYICIIIVVASIVIRPKVSYAICPGDVIHVIQVLTDALVHHPNNLAQITQQLYGMTTGCDDKGNPTTNTGGPTATPDPNVTPGSTNTDEAQFAQQVTDNVHANCEYPAHSGNFGVVTTSNSSCLDSLSSVGVNSYSIDKFKLIPPAAFYLQCVGCAVAIEYARGRPYTGHGNANQHAGQSVANYKYYAYDPNTFINTVQFLTPGSLFISTAGVNGHIGMITDLIKKNGQVVGVQVYECNYPYSGVMKHGRVVPIETIAGWQKPN